MCAACERIRERIKEWRNKKKKRKKIREIKKKKGGHSRHFTFYTIRRSYFAKHFPKRIQLSHVIRFTNTTNNHSRSCHGETEGLPNAP
jgi:DNA polymerase II small subunit/DNA polymerase delta subunit B